MGNLLGIPEPPPPQVISLPPPEALSQKIMEYSIGDRVSYLATDNYNDVVVADIVAIEYNKSDLPQLYVYDGTTIKSINNHSGVSDVIYTNTLGLHSVNKKKVALIPIKLAIDIKGIRYNTGDTVSYKFNGQLIVAKISDIIKNYINGIRDNGIDLAKSFIYVDDGGEKVNNRSYTDTLKFDESTLEKVDNGTPLVQKKDDTQLVQNKDTGNQKYTLEDENEYRLKYVKYKAKYKAKYLLQQKK